MYNFDFITMLNMYLQRSETLRPTNNQQTTILRASFPIEVLYTLQPEYDEPQLINQSIRSYIGSSLQRLTTQAINFTLSWNWLFGCYGWTPVMSRRLSLCIRLFLRRLRLQEASLRCSHPASTLLLWIAIQPLTSTLFSSQPLKNNFLPPCVFMRVCAHFCFWNCLPVFFI